jgi:hypothetical protein
MGAGQLALEVSGTVLDNHADLDVKRGEALLREQREMERAVGVRAARCRCERPFGWRDGGELRCAKCGRRPVANELRSSSGLGHDADEASAERRAVT